ncbi:MAG: hypothetical protein HQL51_13845 [Magnetococcales bacterium]|nr:hypothetical protein [Magnetococcales bacterium]
MSESKECDMLKIFATVFIATLTSHAQAGLYQDCEKAMASLDRSSADKVIEFMVGNEFMGCFSLRNDAIFTPDGEVGRRDKEILEQVGENDYTYGRVLDYDYSKIVIVTQYKVLEVLAHGDKAIAKVEFNQAAASSGESWDRVLHKDHRPHDLVEYNLVRQDSRWYFVDPPIWRISYDYLLDAYPKVLQHLRWTKRKIDPDPTKKFRRNIMLDDLDFLRSIEKTVREHQK